MKQNPHIFLVTTTIHVPHVLKHYRNIHKDIHMIIVGDKKTPDRETRAFVKTLGNAQYLGPQDQEKLKYKSSARIGWNSIQRRNIGFLEALKHGADIIVSVDDDNIPVDRHYINDFISLLSHPYDGLSISSPSGWVNIGEFLTPALYHRGFPYSLRRKDLQHSIRPLTQARIGVAAGLWIGDPDIDAMARITTAPMVYNISDVARAGFVIDQSSVAPFNSQNTAYIRELAPLFMMLTGVGRYDDIWSSYIMQRVMKTTGHLVHFGKPFVWQERNQQNLWKNLKDEVYGMEYTSMFCEDLDAMRLPTDASVTEKLEMLYTNLKKSTYLPPIVFDIASAWLSDLQKVL